MKLIKMMSVALMAIVISVSFSSCLSDPENKFTYEWLPGVVGVQSGSLIVETVVGKIASSDLSNIGLMSGDCVMMSFEYDSSDPITNNDEEKGYLTSTIKSLAEVKEGVVPQATDTTTLLGANELILKNGIASFSYQYFAYLSQKLFLTSTFLGNSKQINSWMLAFDYMQEPVQAGGENTYTVFLRAVVMSQGEGSPTDQNEVNAFDISYAMDYINDIEYAAGSPSFKLRIYYINEVDDEGKPSWRKADDDITFSTYDSSKV